MDYKSAEKDINPTIKYLSWKIPFYLGIIFTIIITLTLIFIKNLFLAKFNNQLINKFYDFFVWMVLINSALATYTLSLYYYRISIPGVKGTKGKKGKIGYNGNPQKCDIFTPRVGYMKTEPEVKLQKYNVNLDSLKESTVNLDIKNNQPGWRPILKNNNIDTTGINDILGSKFAPCLSFDKNSKRKCEYRHNIRVQEKNNKNEYKDTFKPFIGAIFNYDETNKGRNGDIYTAQFLFNKNDKENKDNYKIGLVNGTQGKFGSNENFGNNAEFSCPVNSALYKIETLHEENKVNKNASIKGIKLHCRDINNGDKVKILNNKNDLVDSIYFGVEPNASNNKYYYSQVECGFNKDTNSPGFISNITPVFSNNNINSIKVNACSYYKD